MVGVPIYTYTHILRIPVRIGSDYRSHIDSVTSHVPDQPLLAHVHSSIFLYKSSYNLIFLKKVGVRRGYILRTPAFLKNMAVIITSALGHGNIHWTLGPSTKSYYYLLTETV